MDVLYKLILLNCWGGMFVLAAAMAHERNRSVVLWTLFSIVATPILSLFVLLVLGYNKEQVSALEK